jgi:hypothetical protein
MFDLIGESHRVDPAGPDRVGGETERDVLA